MLMYSVKQVAAWKKVSPSTVGKWIREGRLKAKKNSEGKWEVYEGSLKAMTKKDNKAKAKSKPKAKSNPPKKTRKKSARRKKAKPKNRKRRFAWEL